RIETHTKICHLGAFPPRRPIARNCLLNGVQQVLTANRLSQKFLRSIFHGSHRHGDIAVASHEYDGNLELGLVQFALKIKPAQAWEPHIEHETAWCIGRPPLHEFARRAERLYAKAHGLDETSES